MTGTFRGLVIQLYNYTEQLYRKGPVFLDDVSRRYGGDLRSLLAVFWMIGQAAFIALGQYKSEGHSSEHPHHANLARWDLSM